ncbi:MAG: Nramp family divalent metal transporter [Peptococcaceae bacterium]|jgi:NRAMP (natural resistance-associated macrophage protein)-like metal ion transporter|nr:Nramp family divalent metal transporter [Peptococcaceae bacterium]
MKLNRNLWQTVLVFLLVVGPGIITANVDNDAGGITTYSLAGAQFGYHLLWVFLPVTLALIVIQEMSARMGAVTSKGLADLIREQFGLHLTMLIMLVLLLADIGNTASEFAGLAASMDIFGVTRYLAVPLGGLLVWWMVVKGTYRKVEKIFLVACVFYVAYIVSGLLAHPDWPSVGRNLVTPGFSVSPGYLAMFIGLVGTTIAPWMQFYIQSAVVEKGISPADYRYSRWDVILGCIMTDLVAVFIVIAVAATLYVHHIGINSARDAAVALAPLAGRFASQLFAFGLLNASLFSASILPLATAYSICEALGFEAGVDKTFDEAPQFYGLYTAIIIIGSGLILLPGAPLIPIMFWSQVLNGVLLPVVLVAMLVLINDRSLMGEYTNSRFVNATSWVTAVTMIVLSLMLLLTQLFPHLSLP